MPSAALSEQSWDASFKEVLTDWLQIFVAEFCAD
jgi:hypothetical protein